MGAVVWMTIPWEGVCGWGGGYWWGGVWVVKGVWEWERRLLWWEGERVCGGEGLGDCDREGDVMGRGCGGVDLWYRVGRWLDGYGVCGRGGVFGVGKDL